MNLNQNPSIVIEEKEFENVICKMSAILLSRNVLNVAQSERY